MQGGFPDGFLWGTATAAHQVEGGNVSNDSWLLEHTPGTHYAEVSGDACDHYHRYRDDIALVAGLGLGAFRLSIEWSRIEPEEGEFSNAALDHYRRVLAACHQHGIARSSRSITSPRRAGSPPRAAGASSRRPSDSRASASARCAGSATSCRMPARSTSPISARSCTM